MSQHQVDGYTLPDFIKGEKVFTSMDAPQDAPIVPGINYLKKNELKTMDVQLNTHINDLSAFLTQELHRPQRPRGKARTSEIASSLGMETRQFSLETGWNFELLDHQEQFLVLVDEEMPDEILVAPECKLWSRMQFGGNPDFEDLLNKRHAAKKALLEADTDRRLRRALGMKYKGANTEYQLGQKVWFWRDAKQPDLVKIRWLGPAHVVMKEYTEPHSLEDTQEALNQIRQLRSRGVSRYYDLHKLNKRNLVDVEEDEHGEGGDLESDSDHEMAPPRRRARLAIEEATPPAPEAPNATSAGTRGTRHVRVCTNRARR